MTSHQTAKMYVRYICPIFGRAHACIQDEDKSGEERSDAGSGVEEEDYDVDEEDDNDYAGNYFDNGENDDDDGLGDGLRDEGGEPPSLMPIVFLLMTRLHRRRLRLTYLSCRSPDMYLYHPSFRYPVAPSTYLSKQGPEPVKCALDSSTFVYRLETRRGVMLQRLPLPTQCISVEV